MEVQLLLYLLLVFLIPSSKASWLSSEQGQVDGEQQYFSNPQSVWEEPGNYVSNDNRGIREEVFIDKRSTNERENIFDDLKENLSLPDDKQQNILKELSQAAINVPDAVSELMQEEIGGIEKEVDLPFRDILPFDEILPEASTDNNFNTEYSSESKEDEIYGSGEDNTQEEHDESSTSDDGKNSTEGSSLHEQNKTEFELGNGHVKKRKEKERKGTHSVKNATIKKRGEKDNPDEGNDDDDHLDPPVAFSKKQLMNKTVHSNLALTSSDDLEGLGNLVVDLQTGKNNGESKESRTVDEFSSTKGNVSKSSQIKSGGDANTSSPNGTYSKLYSMPQNDKNKKQVNFDKPNERSKRSQNIENNKHDIAPKRHHVNDDDDVDYIRLKKSGIFENIADAFAHIDKTRKETEKVVKKKKSTLEKIHETNPNQPVNGGFTSWTDWSECSETCGKDSIKMRMRVCTNPPPSNGGKDCQGWRFEVKYCKLPSCKEQQEKVPEIAIEDIQQAKQMTATAHARNSSLGMESMNKTAEKIKQQRSKTNHIIETMFKDVIHKAFDKSKANATKKHANITKSAPIEIHTDAGLIASENEVDTIDDAPDTSQDMEPEGQEIQQSQNMESEGPSPQNMESQDQASPAPQDMESQTQEMQSSQDMESEEVENQPRMESEGEENSVLQDMESQDQENPQSSHDVHSQGQEPEGGAKSDHKGETYKSQESQSSQDTNVKQTEESQSSQDTNVKQPEESQSSQDTNVKQPEESQSSQDTKVKQPEESQLSQDTNVKQPEESQSSQDTNVKQPEESQSSQDTNVKQPEESQSSQDTKVKQPEESQLSQDTNVKQPEESQSSQDTNVKQPEESQSSQDTKVKQPEEGQSSPQDTNVKQPEESQLSQDTDVKQPEESQSSQDTKVKQPEESQLSQDTNVKQPEESQSSQDTNVKQPEESQSSQDTKVKQPEEGQSSPQDTNVKQPEESQLSQDTNVKQPEESQSSQDTKVKQPEEGQSSPQDTNVKQPEESQSSQDTIVKQPEESQSSQEIKVKQPEESQSFQDTNIKQPEESHSSQDTKVKQPEESQPSQDTKVKQPEESQLSQDTNVKQPEESQSSQDTNVKQPEESQSSQDTNVKQPEESQSSQEIKVKQPEESQSSQDTKVKQPEESQSSQDTKVKQPEESQLSQDTNVKQDEESQSSQETNVIQASEKGQSAQAVYPKQSKASQTAHSDKNGQGTKDESSKKGNKTNSIDGNFDIVIKEDDKDQNEIEKTEMAISKVATEIMKNNDTDGILKALSDNVTDILDSYTEGDANKGKKQETQSEKNEPHYHFITSNHSKARNNSALEKGQDNRHATEKTGKDQEHVKQAALSSEGVKSKNGNSSSSSSNMKASGQEAKEGNNVTSSVASDEKNKGKEPLKGSKEGTKQDISKNQEKLDSTLNKQDEKLQTNSLSPDQESFSGQKQNDTKGVASIDWGNLHALNALVEILAEHEANGTQNNTNTNQTQNDLRTPTNNTVVIDTKTKNVDVITATQESQANKTEATSHTTHDSGNAGKDNKKINIDDYTKHDGGKRQNVTGEGNARDKSNLTMPENPNAGQTATKMIDTSTIGNEKNKTDTSVDTLQGTTKKKKNSTTHQRSLFNLLKEVVLSLQDPDSSNFTAKLDEIEKVTNTTEKYPENTSKTLTPWTAWTTCSKSCGQGIKTRMRECLLDENDCKGPLNQTERCQLANCSVDGGFTEWTAWSSACSAKCGEGVFKTRSRTCTNPEAKFGGKPCEGASIEQQDCKLKPCVGFEIAGKIGSQTLLPNKETQTHQDEKEKGFWGQWSEWSTCTATCGGEGYSSRERTCLPGKKCKGPRYDTKACGTDPCPVDGGYTPWTAWSPCTPSCGLRAYRMRTRNCTNPPPAHGGRKCYDSALETEPCKIVNCPIDGSYSSWSSWSSCTKSCGTPSFSQRERTCSSPEPKYGGRPCKGESAQTKDCHKKPCVVNGGFSEWSRWTPCANVSCESNLSSTRNRTCDNPRPQFGGKNCTGDLVEKKSCRPKHCPIDGGFSSWSAWSACPKNCKVSGVAHRKRRCDNPKPQNGGRNCVGPKIDTKVCSNTCPVDGGFTEWTSWSKCSQECGRTSIRSRERYCTNPSPANDGKKCKGSRFQVKICSSDGCPVNGNYTAWSDWTACPRCGFGVQIRERTCTNPSPINGGNDCVGPAKETVACPFKRCRDNGFGQWSSYGHCSKSCGGGAKMRRRTCEDESKGCDGKFVQLKPCNQQSCVLGNDHLIDVNPESLCGFNPCKISRCLGYPEAKCLTSSGCWPVFFDKRGSILESCKGDKTVFSSSPEMICHNDPCKVSGCYTDEAASCHVSIRCKPVFLDSGGNKLDCRGLLKVPPVTLCGADPCEGSSCDLDKNARCIADYNCNPVFISTENEILSKCKVSKYRDNNYIINSKAGKKSIETNQDMENIKSQLQAFLTKSGGDNERVETISEYNSLHNPGLTPDQQDGLEYKLQHLKKRNRFYKPRKTKS